MPYLGHGWYAAGSDKGTYVSGDMVFLVDHTISFMLLLMKSH